MLQEKQIMFFGCPLDCDEKYDAIQEKITHFLDTDESDDPLDHVMTKLTADLPEKPWKNFGSIKIPDWLRPNPPLSLREELTSENFVAYMDNGGCQEMAQILKSFVLQNIIPGIPCMIGVDHSLTGGVFEALSNSYQPDRLSLIVVDTHTDAIRMSALSEAISYDMDMNPDSPHDPNDPLLYGRPDSYNASSFIHHLLQNQIVYPENLYIVGVSDYPDKRAIKIKDQRLAHYVGEFTNLRRRGVKIVTKKDLKQGTAKLKSLLKKIRTPYAYISFDMDIGALNALEGVRFLNYEGLKESSIYKIADVIREILQTRVSLAGLDVMEFNTRKAGKSTISGLDPTYRIAANLIKTVALDIK